MKKIIKIKESDLVNLIDKIITESTKKEDIITEIADAKVSFNTELEKNNDVYSFEIKDERFNFNDFHIYIKLTGSEVVALVNKGNKDIKNTVADVYKLAANKYKDNALDVSFGFFDPDGWSFPILNTGDLFKIMATVVKSIKYVLSENKQVKYIIYKPVSKNYKPKYFLKLFNNEKELPIKKGPYLISDIIKMLEKNEINNDTLIKRNDLNDFVKIGDLEEIKTYNKSEGDLISDKGAKRKKLYKAYLIKFFPNASIIEHNNFVIVKIK